MAYFPEYQGGEMWANALSNLGQNIGESIRYYQERHQKLNEADAEFNALHARGVIDDKAYERISLAKGGERLANETGYMQALQFGSQLSQHSLDAAYKQAEIDRLHKQAGYSELSGTFTYGPAGQVTGQYDAYGKWHTMKTDPGATQTEKEDALMKQSRPLARGIMVRNSSTGAYEFSNTYDPKKPEWKGLGSAAEGPIMQTLGPDGVIRNVPFDYWEKSQEGGVQAKPGTKPSPEPVEPGQPQPGQTSVGQPQTAPSATPDATTARQAGDLEPGKSRRQVNGKWYTWTEKNGKFGWVPE
jgi:hypothetical protein